jgi:hypothetical protein
MCGLVYYKSFNGSDVIRDAIWRYQAQRTRGTEGFGFYLPSFNELVHSPSEDRILTLLRSYEAPEVLYHHRRPTSTANVENACHPFNTGDFFDKRYVLIHNGMVHNAATLKAEHERMGIEYSSMQPDAKFNDSEALLWDVALYLEGQQSKLTAEGSIAFIIIEHDVNDRARKLHFARNSSPLYIQIDDKRLALASEAKWKENESAEMIMSNFLYSFTYSSRTLGLKALEVPTYSYAKSYPYATSHISHVSPGASGAGHYDSGSTIPRQNGGAWQKPTFTPPALPPSPVTVTPSSLATKKTILTPELIGQDSELEADSLKAVERFVNKYGSYDEAADELKAAIGRISRTLRQMEALDTPRAKTIKKYGKMLRYHRVLILAEDCIFELMAELAENDAEIYEAAKEAKHD